MFQEFAKAIIDFGQLDLLDDTVTRISLTLAEQNHKPIPIRIVPNDYQTEAMDRQRQSQGRQAPNFECGEGAITQQTKRNTLVDLDTL